MEKKPKTGTIVAGVVGGLGSAALVTSLVMNDGEKAPEAPAQTGADTTLRQEGPAAPPLPVLTAASAPEAAASQSAAAPYKPFTLKQEAAQTLAQEWRAADQKRGVEGYDAVQKVLGKLRRISFARVHDIDNITDDEIAKLGTTRDNMKAALSRTAQEAAQQSLDKAVAQMQTGGSPAEAFDALMKMETYLQGTVYGFDKETAAKTMIVNGQSMTDEQLSFMTFKQAGLAIDDSARKIVEIAGQKGANPAEQEKIEKALADMHTLYSTALAQAGKGSPDPAAFKQQTGMDYGQLTQRTQEYRIRAITKTQNEQAAQFEPKPEPSPSWQQRVQEPAPGAVLNNPFGRRP